MNLIISEDQLKALVEKWNKEGDWKNNTDCSSEEQWQASTLWDCANDLSAILATAKRVECHAREKRGDGYLVDSAKWDVDHATSPLFSEPRAFEVTHSDGRIQLLPEDCADVAKVCLEQGRQVIALYKRVEVDDAMIARLKNALPLACAVYMNIYECRAALQAALGQGEDTFASALMKAQQTPSPEDRALIYDNLDYLLGQGEGE